MSYASKERFAKEVKKYRNDLYRFALTIMKNEADAQDAVGDAILKAFENRESLKSYEKFKPWIMQILSNTCYSMLKKNTRVVLVEDAWELKEPVEKKPDEMWELVMGLEDDFREVVCLYYYEGFSIKEIGRLLSVSEGTVKSRLSRAREKLKVLL